MNRSSVLGIGRASVHAASADDRPAVQRDGVAGREVGLVAGGEKDETMLLMTPSPSGAFLARRTSTEKTPPGLDHCRLQCLLGAIEIDVGGDSAGGFRGHLDTNPPAETRSARVTSATLSSDLTGQCPDLQVRASIGAHASMAGEGPRGRRGAPQTAHFARRVRGSTPRAAATSKGQP